MIQSSLKTVLKSQPYVTKHCKSICKFKHLISITFVNSILKKYTVGLQNAQRYVSTGQYSFVLETKNFFFIYHLFTSLGKWTNHKGRSRRFTNPDELEEQRKREEQEKWLRRNNRGGEESSSEDEKPATKGNKSNSEDETESDSESDEDSDDVRFNLAFFFCSPPPLCLSIYFSRYVLDFVLDSTLLLKNKIITFFIKSSKC